MVVVTLVCSDGKRCQEPFLLLDPTVERNLLSLVMLRNNRDKRWIGLSKNNETESLFFLISIAMARRSMRSFISGQILRLSKAQ